MSENVAHSVAERNGIYPPISVSYHPGRTVAVKTFRQRKVRSLQDVADVVSNWVWSPILYKNDHRHKDNFLSASWIGLDVDDGMTLDDAISLLKEFQATSLVGVTGSHQKQKGEEPPCDRFRVLLQMVSPCTDCELFEYNVRSWRKIFSGDRATTDGARLFKPSKVVFMQEGFTQDWLPFPKGYLTKKERDRRRAVTILRHQQNRTIPTWVLRAQKEGVPPGHGQIKGRHHVCYKIGATLTELGYTTDEITDFLCSGPLISIGAADVRRQVECGAEKARGSAIASLICGGVSEEK